MFVTQKSINDQFVLATKQIREIYRQKQSFRDVRKKRCSVNIQQIYRKTPMPKYDVKKENSGQ